MAQYQGIPFFHHLLILLCQAFPISGLVGIVMMDAPKNINFLLYNYNNNYNIIIFRNIYIFEPTAGNNEAEDCTYWPFNADGQPAQQVGKGQQPEEGSGDRC